MVTKPLITGYYHCSITTTTHLWPPALQLLSLAATILWWSIHCLFVHLSALKRLQNDIKGKIKFCSYCMDSITSNSLYFSNCNCMSCNTFYTAMHIGHIKGFLNEWLLPWHHNNRNQTLKYASNFLRDFCFSEFMLTCCV